MVAIAAMLSWYKQAERQGGGPRPPAARPGLRGGRRMRGRAVLLLALLVLAGPAWAELPAECSVAAHLVETSYPLPKVKRAIAEKKLNILVVGAGSSQLPGRERRKERIPGAIEQALADQLRASRLRSRPTSKRRAPLPRWLRRCRPISPPQNPRLMIWQPGTTDAMRAVDPDQFSQALDQGINITRCAGADVVLVNAQYSPRTESMIALEHLFGRHALGCIAARSAAVRPIQHHAAVVGPRNIRFILCNKKT